MSYCVYERDGFWECLGLRIHFPHFTDEMVFDLISTQEHNTNFQDLAFQDFQDPYLFLALFIS